MSPDDHYVSRASLISSLAHEGLHAAKATPGEGCLDEELDGRLAGNAALVAVGLTANLAVGLSHARSIDSLKVDYPSLAADPTYVPLGGTWPNPWSTAF